jgi:hypothetical protein
MPASHVQVQPDGTGKDVDADSLVSTEAGTPTVYRQDIVVADPVNYAGKVRVFAPGQQRVTMDPTQLFLDTFDTSLDTANRWVTPVASGTGAVAATWSAGQVLLTGGTAANAYSVLTSQPSFAPDEPGWLQVTMRVNVEFPVLATAYRFWGLAITPGTPTVSAPVTEGAGWEVSTAGVFAAVTYAGGVRTQIAALTAPGNASAHKYILFFRGDLAYWALDDPDNVVASYLTGASGPNINTLPLKCLVVSNSGTTATLQVNGVSVGDTARNNVSISDDANPWRQSTVTAGGALSVSANATRTQMAWGTVSAGLTAGTTATDAMIVLGQQFRAGASAGTTGTSWAVTAGKTFRVTSMTVGLLANAALVSSAVFTLRYNPAGAAVAGSAPSLVATLGVPAVAGQMATCTVPVPDGVDLPGGTTPGQFGVSVNPAWATTAPQVYVWISGYEW